ncbi:SufE family protein [Truepera radiovictrix]|uniref:Fe-S metabolism associated SufE n=1 Tax=Truepera radiovictrix (strain DSM 17093 / CIP 108686 / LMG 22925 / RQ-24) TaxID=649638 RepID=D7CU18_TRURR|nr:SufE family protein [Truepera radiovictrix]ADI13916.1 Fe-S metabolism associated SufE [Truepera radiovictrix DSM 17093]WMT57519.1 SufE family protein [Truepera radiovictrix]
MSVPAKLQTIVESFQSAPKQLRLQLLLEYSKKVPPLPEYFRDHHDAMERVHECQTPFFIATEFPDEARVVFHFDAPPEAPTTRGFAGVLSEGLNGLSPDEVLATPDNFYEALKLGEVISPLRLRGMSAIMSRLKRQVREHQGLE